MSFGSANISKVGLFDSRVKFPKGLKTAPRPVKRYEIEVYTDDQPGITYLNERAVPLKKGTLIVAKPGMMRHSRLPFKCLSMHVKVTDQGLAALLDQLPDVCYVADLQPIIDKFHRIYPWTGRPSRRKAC